METLKKIENLNYTLAWTAPHTMKHSGNIYLQHPPNGYEYTINPYQPTKEDIQNVYAAIINFPNNKCDILEQWYKIAEQHGIYNVVADFLKKLHIPTLLRASKDAKIGIMSTWPVSFGIVPTILMIENIIPLYHYFFGHGMTYDINIFSHPATNLIRSLLESDIFIHIICSIEQTYRSMGIIFGEKVFNKCSYTKLGTILPEYIPIRNYDTDEIQLFFPTAFQNETINFMTRGGKEVVTAFRAIKTKYPKIKLVIRARVGWWKAILKDIPDLEIIEDHIPFDDYQKLLFNSHIILMPSEGIHSFGIMEGMAYGLPIVASDGYGFWEYIENGYNGFMIGGRFGCDYWIDDRGFPREDWRHIYKPEPNKILTDNLIGALDYLLSNRSLLYKISSNARNDAEEIYSMDKFNERLKPIFDKVY